MWYNIQNDKKMICEQFTISLSFCPLSPVLFMEAARISGVILCRYLCIWKRFLLCPPKFCLSLPEIYLWVFILSKWGKGGKTKGIKIQRSSRMGNCSIEEETHNFGEENGIKTPYHVFSALLLCLRKLYRNGSNI